MVSSVAAVVAGAAAAAAGAGGAGVPAGVRVEVHDLLVDIKAEKVEATEVKLDDLDLSPEVLGVGGVGITGGGSGVGVGVGGGGGVENGPLVEVDSLLDSNYCASIHKLNGTLAPKELAGINNGGTGIGTGGTGHLDDGSNLGPLITLADEKDMPSVPSNNGFLFPKSDEKLLPSLASPSPDPLVLVGAEQPTGAPSSSSSVSSSVLQTTTSASDDLSLLAHMTTCGSDLAQAAATASAAGGAGAAATTPGAGAGSGLPEDVPFKMQNALVDISTLAEAEANAAARSLECGEGAEGGTASSSVAAGGLDGGDAAGKTAAGDAASTTSDTERSDDGKDKEMKKIQTTATTQVRQGLFCSETLQEFCCQVNTCPVNVVDIYYIVSI